MRASVIPALERWKQEDQKVEVSLICHSDELEASLGNTRPYLNVSK